jgi:hypothetical protein
MAAAVAASSTALAVAVRQRDQAELRLSETVSRIPTFLPKLALEESSARRRRFDTQRNLPASYKHQSCPKVGIDNLLTVTAVPKKIESPNNNQSMTVSAAIANFIGNTLLPQL